MNGSLPPVRRANTEDARAIAELLHDFNREFGEPTPSVETLEQRIAHLLHGGDTLVLLVGGRPDGLAVLRFRDAIWSSGLECYLAELYVTPANVATDSAAPSWKQPCRGPDPRRRLDGDRR